MDKDSLTKMKAYVAAITFAVLVGFSFIGIKTCVPVASTLHILTWRYNWAFLGLLIILVLKLGKLELRGKPKKNLMLTAIFYISFMILQTFGLIFSTSIESAILFAIIPVITKFIASTFLGEKSTSLQNIFTCLSVSALIVMIVMGATKIEANLFGIVILLLSSMCMATSNVFMRYVRAVYKPIEITAMIATMGFVLFNATTLVYGIYSGDLSSYFAPLGNSAFVISTIYLGTGCILGSVLLMAYMLKTMEAVKATIFGNLSTAISIVAGLVVLGETLMLYHIICTILIIAGVIGVSFAGTKKLD